MLACLSFAASRGCCSPARRETASGGAAPWAPVTSLRSSPLERSGPNMSELADPRQEVEIPDNSSGFNILFIYFLTQPVRVSVVVLIHKTYALLYRLFGRRFREFRLHRWVGARTTTSPLTGTTRRRRARRARPRGARDSAREAGSTERARPFAPLVAFLSWLMLL